MVNSNKIIILFIFILPFVSAQNISVDYEEKEEVGEEFSINIGLSNFAEDIYDIKIDTNVGGTNVARVLVNNELKSTYYYVNDIISNDEIKEFILKVDNYVGIINMTIKVKDSSGSIESFSGYEIEILASSQNEEEITNEPNYENDSSSSSEVSESQQQNDGEAKIVTAQADNAEEDESKITSYAINLEPKNIKSEEDDDYNYFAILSLMAFCLLLAFLFALKIRRGKSDKNGLV